MFHTPVLSPRGCFRLRLGNSSLFRDDARDLKRLAQAEYESPMELHFGFGVVNLNQLLILPDSHRINSLGDQLVRGRFQERHDFLGVDSVGGFSFHCPLPPGDPGIGEPAGMPGTKFPAAGESSTFC